MKKTFLLFLFLYAWTTLHAAVQDNEKITLEDLLDEIISFEDAVYFPDYTCHQESSYDRRSVASDVSGWWANSDGFGFIRTDVVEGRTEKVLFDQHVSVVITRIWITTQDKISRNDSSGS